MRERGVLRSPVAVERFLRAQPVDSARWHSKRIVLRLSLIRISNRSSIDVWFTAHAAAPFRLTHFDPGPLRSAAARPALDVPSLAPPVKTKRHAHGHEPNSALHAGSHLHRKRRLAGGADRPIYFYELSVPPIGFAERADCDGSSCLLLFGLRAPLLLQSEDPCAPTQRLNPEQAILIAGPQQLHLTRAEESPAEALVCRFARNVVPEGLKSALPRGAGQSRGPLPVAAELRNVVIGVRSCPVLEALREFWAAAKLAEALALLGPISESSVAATGPRPAEDAIATGRPRWHPAVVRALEYMERHLGESLDLPSVARAAGASPAHLSRLFTRELGEGPTHYLRRLRLDRAAALLRSGEANVTEAAFAVGYASLGQFSRAFLAHHGVPPSALRASAGARPAPDRPA